MYVTPDISGVEIKILGAAAQPFGAKIEILVVVAQLLAWWRALAHKEGNSGFALTYIHCKICARSIPKTFNYVGSIWENKCVSLVSLELFCNSYKVND